MISSATPGHTAQTSLPLLSTHSMRSVSVCPLVPWALVKPMIVPPEAVVVLNHPTMLKPSGLEMDLAVCAQPVEPLGVIAPPPSVEGPPAPSVTPSSAVAVLALPDASASVVDALSPGTDPS